MAIKHSRVMLVWFKNMREVPVPKVKAVRAYIIFNFLAEGKKAEKVV
jgi:hypothetical protein